MINLHHLLAPTAPEGETKKDPPRSGRQAFHYAPFLFDPGRQGSTDHTKEPLSCLAGKAALCLLAFLYEKQLCEGEYV
jgi:hypothetical protein